MLSIARIVINARIAAMRERGASAVEYGLLIAGIAAVIVIAVIALGGSINGIFEDTDDAINEVP